MSTSTFIFDSKEIKIEAITEEMASLYKINKVHSKVMYHSLLDTFDWRIYHSKQILQQVKPFRGSATLILTSRQKQAPLIQVQNTQSPVFIEEIEDSVLQQELKPIIEMRALIHQIKLKGHQTAYQLLDNENKTVVRFCIEQFDTNEKIEFPTLLSLQSLRGYQKPFKKIKSIIKAQTKITPLKIPFTLKALNLQNQSIGEYSSKLNLKLNPKESILKSTQQIYKVLFNTIEANIDGVKQNIDSEFLHDFRVAVRRTRSALSQMKGVFPPIQTNQFKTDFKWIGSATGTVRDLDVYLLAFETYQQQLPKEKQADLVPFKTFLIQQHKTEQLTLKRFLNTKEFKAKLIQLKPLLTENPEEQGEKAQQPTLIFASQQIWKHFKKVRKQGALITPNSPAEHLHDLRKECKKLRYMMEFFRSLYPTKIEEQIKQLKKLLDNLGDFQDFEVQANQITLFAQQMVLQTQSKIAVETYLAMGMLVKNLIEQQNQARTDFQVIFNQFNTTERTHIFKAYFKTSK